MNMFERISLKKRIIFTVITIILLGSVLVLFIAKWVLLGIPQSIGASLPQIGETITIEHKEDGDCEFGGFRFGVVPGMTVAEENTNSRRYALAGTELTMTVGNCPSVDELGIEKNELFDAGAVMLANGVKDYAALVRFAFSYDYDSASLLSSFALLRERAVAAVMRQTVGVRAESYRAINGDITGCVFRREDVTTVFVSANGAAFCCIISDGSGLIDEEMLQMLLETMSV